MNVQLEPQQHGIFRLRFVAVKGFLIGLFVGIFVMEVIHTYRASSRDVAYLKSLTRELEARDACRASGALVEAMALARDAGQTMEEAVKMVPGSRQDLVREKLALTVYSFREVPPQPLRYAIESDCLMRTLHVEKLPTKTGL